MTKTNQEISTSFQTLVEMMKARALYPSVQELIDFRDNTLPGMLKSAVRPVFALDFATCSLRVVYNLHPKFKVVDIRRLITESDATTVVLVTQSYPSTLALKNLSVSDKEINVFNIEELQYDVAKHSLVPKHEPIRGQAEIAATLKHLNVKTKSQLPQISSTEAMARYLALKPGELVRITRYSPSAGEYILYRCCFRGAL